MKKITIIVLVVLLVLTGAVSYVTYSAADSLVHSPHETALDEEKN